MVCKFRRVYSTAKLCLCYPCQWHAYKPHSHTLWTQYLQLPEVKFGGLAAEASASKTESAERPLSMLPWTTAQSSEDDLNAGESTNPFSKAGRKAAMASESPIGGQESARATQSQHVSLDLKAIGLEDCV